MMETVEVSPFDLKPHSDNPRRGNVDLIKESIQAHGMYRPVVVNSRNNTIVAGHHMVKAAKELGFETVPVVYVDYDEDQHRRVMLMDNRSADVGEYDTDILLAILGSMDNPAVGTGYTDDDIRNMLNADREKRDWGSVKDNARNKDSVSKGEPVTKPGDVWLLGPHRLLCGDSTKRSDIERVLAGQTPDLVIADPPYGIGLLGKGTASGNGNQYDVAHGDDDTTIAVESVTLLLDMFPDARQAWWGANYYSNALPASQSWFVWNKIHPEGLTMADGELCWTTNQVGGVRIFDHRWQGVAKASERGEAWHPTPKPVAVLQWTMGKLSRGADWRVLLDPFNGAGPGIIAAQREGKVACGIEITPVYCDKTAMRWQKETGIKPVLESTGEEHDFPFEAEGDDDAE